MFIIHLIFFSYVSTIPRRYNYNCFSMHAELFPVIKMPCNYGNRSYQLRGKDYDKLQANMPKYTQKIEETQKELSKSIPTEFEEALAEYVKFRKILFARDNQVGFNQSEDDEFKDRMKLLLYYKILDRRVVRGYAGIVEHGFPVEWLDTSYLLYRHLDMGIYMNYVRPSRLRKSKVISKLDYCAKLAESLKTDNGWAQGKAKNAHTLVFRCYDIFPYNDDAAKKIFDLSLLMTEFYVFHNYTSNGIGAGVVFRTLKEQVLHFDSSLRFHEFFGRTIDRLNDAHLSYKVDCYEQFTFVQPLYIQHYLDENGISGVYITKVNIPELQEWVNAEVLVIDGYCSNCKIGEFGDRLGKCFNGYTRFSLGLSRVFFESSSQDFKLDRGFYLKRTSIPEKSYLIYSIKKPNTDYIVDIKVDWIVFKNSALVDFQDQYSYWRNNCETKPLKRIIKASTTNLQRRSSGALKLYTENKKSPLRGKKMQKRSDTTTTYKATVDGTIPIAAGPGFAFFVLNDSAYGGYGVLIIQTFDVQNTDIWFENMRLGFMTLIKKGITRLLLDLTGNSGGMLCLAYSLLSVLSPSDTYPFPATKFTYGTRAVPSDSLIRIAACANEAKVKVSPFKLQCFTNLETRTDFPDGYDWGTNNEVKPKIVNGLTYGYTRFSSFLMDKCVLKSSPLLADVNPKFTTIMVVSDNLCGSSCAIVAAYLHQHGSPAIVMSPINKNDTPAALYSFAGGQVVNFNNIKDVAIRSSCLDMIPNILEKAQMSITYRAIFNIEDKRNPLEYYYLPAHYTFPYNLEYVNSFASRWRDFFQKGMEIFENPIKFAVDTSETGTTLPF